MAWLMRGLIFAFLIAQIRPAPPHAPLQPQQTVSTQLPRLCVHTRLIDEVDEWKIQRSLQMVREMGAPAIVEFFPWAYIEAQEGRFDWTQADRIVRHARNQGIRIIARLGLVPAWAQRDISDDDRQRTTLNTLPEASFPAFVRYASALAERYTGTIDHLIIWNEPNLAFEWGYSEVDPSSYVRLLEMVYPQVHAVNPSVIVLAGALAPTLEPEGSPAGLNDIVYLEQMYEAGAADYFDGLAVHTYGFQHPADAAPADDQLNFRRVELLRSVMEAHGDTVKPIFITETGWNDHPRWSHAVSPAERITFTLDAIRMAHENWDWLETLCLWVFRYPAPTLSYPDNFTLVTTDFIARPLYRAIQAYAAGQTTDELGWLPDPAGAP